MWEWSITETLNCIYFSMFALGVGYALITAIMGKLASFDLPGMDIDIPGVDLHPGGPDIHLELPFAHEIAHDIDHPDVGLSPLSPITLATFVTVFGGSGVLLNNFTAVSPLLSLLISTVNGLAVAGVMFLLYARLLAGLQASSEVEVGELVGKVGEVIAPIPAGKVGEIALVVRGSRMTATARSAEEGRAIARGAVVVVTQVVGNVVEVKPREVQPESH
ncbi:MAG: hypothetical protein JW900_09895 [Anaerolineae bacterium]|nr:hypothetical protein [Anaerolineae bacterium]